MRDDNARRLSLSAKEQRDVDALDNIAYSLRILRDSRANDTRPRSTPDEARLFNIVLGLLFGLRDEILGQYLPPRELFRQYIAGRVASDIFAWSDGATTITVEPSRDNGSDETGPGLEK